MMRWRPLRTMPRSSQELRRRLTVNSVVPVISAMSWRDGKVDFHTGVHAPSRLLHKTQQGARDATLDPLRADRIRLVPERARAAEGVAGTDDAKDHPVALRRNLCQPHTAACEHEERISGLSFVEEELAGADRFRVRLSSDP